MSKNTIYYVDRDLSHSGLYSFQKQHAPAARELGYRFVSLIEKGHPHPQRSQSLSDEVIELDMLTTERFETLLRERNDAILLCTYPGQHAPGLDVHLEIEIAAKRLGLPIRRSDGLRRANDKALMRQTLAEKGVPSAAFAKINSRNELDAASKTISFPVILKPVAGAGSALTRRCNSPEELASHYAQFCDRFASVGLAAQFSGVSDGVGAALVEELLEGVELTVECIVFKGKPHGLIVNEKLHVSYEKSTVLEHLLVSPPTGLSQEDIRAVKAYAEEVLLALDLSDTLVHLELFLTVNGPRVIEVNPRVGGFEVPREFRQFLNINPFHTGLNLLLGRMSDEEMAEIVKRSQDVQPHHAMFVIYPPKSGFLLGLEGVKDAAKLDGICDFSEHLTDNWIDIDSAEHFVAKFWAKVESADNARRLYDSACATVRPIMSETSAQRASG
ncbi:ATP-grasp domain-containing protein [Agrobacterium vitis]|uniref:ATP-grasp domain-containing protein n=1 Tax=Agrobacterium vitis TaxID=373 RepID=UPI0012E8598F|nr:ATP-grasp domain-containing protein [Agrobacterium vitis]MVA63659.1 ATP-grasp domain-containing protein [Agrobacterium vitis]